MDVPKVPKIKKMRNESQIQEQKYSEVRSKIGF